jgi:hypothetical protein
MHRPPARHSRWRWRACATGECHIHGQDVFHEFIIRAVVDDVVVGDDKGVGRERGDNGDLRNTSDDHWKDADFALGGGGGGMVCEQRFPSARLKPRGRKLGVFDGVRPPGTMRYFDRCGCNDVAHRDVPTKRRRV